MAPRGAPLGRQRRLPTSELLGEVPQVGAHVVVAQGAGLLNLHRRPRRRAILAGPILPEALLLIVPSAAGPRSAAGAIYPEVFRAAVGAVFNVVQ